MAHRATLDVPLRAPDNSLRARQSVRVSARARVGVIASVVAVVALSVGGVLALAHGPGTQSAAGKVASISAVRTGYDVCVQDAKSGRKRCGWVSASRLSGIQVGGCAYIKVTRGAALSLAPRTCS